MRDPKTLDEWYEGALRAYNAETRIGILATNRGGTSSHKPPRNEWDMDLDAIILGALSKDERTRHYVINRTTCQDNAP